MSKLDDLGGLENAKSMRDNYARRNEGPATVFLDALIERVEELEREIADERTHHVGARMTIEKQVRELEPLRDLAEMVLKDADSFECVAPGLALVAKARECLSNDKQ